MEVEFKMNKEKDLREDTIYVNSKARPFLYYQIYCFMIKTCHANWTYLSYVLGWPKDIQTGDN